MYFLDRMNKIYKIMQDWQVHNLYSDHSVHSVKILPSLKNMIIRGEMLNLTFGSRGRNVNFYSVFQLDVFLMG